MSRPHFVVVQDHELAEGDVLDSEVAAQQVEGRGGIVLPYSALLANALGGSASTAYQRKMYGSLGWIFDGRAPKRGCPIPVFMSGESVRVAWVAAFAGDVLDGSILKLAPDHGGYADVRDADVRQLNGGLRVVAQDARTEVTNHVRGVSIVGGQVGRFAVLCLLGVCADLRVMWLAATVLPR